MLALYLLSICILVPSGYSVGILYPRPSETREVIPLNGVWDFILDNGTESLDAVNWRAGSDGLQLNKMPVPSSFNDIGTEDILRDHVGLVWYRRTFFVPSSWSKERTWVRFSSVCRAGTVYINGELAVSHEIGHLPFQKDISELVLLGEENTIVVAVDNRLLETTIPQGYLEILAGGRLKQDYTFDFYNYAGIDRPVVLFTTPQTYIDDITITTDVAADGKASVNYNIAVLGDDKVTSRITLLDKSGAVVATATPLKGTLPVDKPNLWWPYLMDPNPGYLYTLQVELLDDSGNLVDTYKERLGIRTLAWGPKSYTINGKPIYMRGFGRHEDSDIRGKGFDLPLILRDHNLMRWIGANAYRTSHYPYADEIMDLADELGIMIIDESPAVNTENFTVQLLENHKQSITELIQRDKNRPSVVLWSAANEPRTQYEESDYYYKEVIAHLKSLDTSRPVTVVNNQLPDIEHSGKYIDIATCNVYIGWYTSTGDLDVIFDKVSKVVRDWNRIHNIPVIMTEYGADTQEGLHLLPAYVWSEEYQDVYLSRNFETFDALREEGIFVGEMIWNYADFKTSQTYRRVGGNRKGIFSRNRQPKSAAHLVRKRYWNLAQELDNVTLPEDLNLYTHPTKQVEYNL